MGIEDPDADRFDQERPVFPEDDEDPEVTPEEIPLDADPQDVLDQYRTVPVDDEDLDES